MSAASMALKKSVSTPFGDPSAAVESEPYATRWRIDLRGMLKRIDTVPEGIDGLVKLGEKFRLWRFLKKKSGETFASFKDFCETPEPHGLGTSERVIRSALEQLHGKRAVQLETVPEPSKPGPKAEPSIGPIKGSECPELSPRTAKVLRAINRAPEPIREAYREGRIGQALAAKLGPRAPTPEQAAAISEISDAVRRLRDRKEIDSVVRSHLGVKVKTPMQRAVAIVERMQAADRLELKRQLEPLFLDAEAEVKERA